MRIISQDGTRSFPLEHCGVTLRYKVINDENILAITCLFNGKEYDMGYYKDEDMAWQIVNDINTFTGELPFEDPDTHDIEWTEVDYLYLPKDKNLEDPADNEDEV